MRLGVLAEDGSAPDAVVTVVSSGEGTSVIPGTQMAEGYTSGPSVTGDTLVCPPGYPYDYGIHDCSGYAGSPADTTTQQLQADIDACQSGGWVWDEALRRCIYPTQTTAGQLISGIPNSALLIAGGVLLFALIAGKK